MCIEYTDLNKAILKNPFPLPCIDQVVDAVVGHEVLYFLDVQPLDPDGLGGHGKNSLRHR